MVDLHSHGNENLCMEMAVKCELHMHCYNCLLKMCANGYTSLPATVNVGKNMKELQNSGKCF